MSALLTDRGITQYLHFRLCIWPLSELLVKEHPFDMMNVNVIG
jgi:hypothetical protein